MTRKEFDAFIKTQDKLEREVTDLFRYIKGKYVSLLAFGTYASYHHHEVSEDSITIEYYDYGYDCYDSSTITIPIDDFLNRPKEWADDWATEILNKRKKIKEQELIMQKEKELKELQRLKEKYEK